MSTAAQQAFAQGARCGHLEGKGRAGQYVIGEEVLMAHVATNAQHTMPAEVYSAWHEGYEHGYKLAASGDALEPEYVDEEIDALQ